ncbi:DUF6531 domain-containing protein [Pendulispora rubella]|uniref:DUF6531 domain-containing protein n=1 Tax=Pendulispora rubella TaxID=2741070 RepID=A0ABZ2LGA3_9BACT
MGHPVDVASGAFFDSVEDIALPGAVPLVLGRTYNTDFLASEAGPLMAAAEDARLLPFGPGWRADWQSELHRTLDGFKYARNDGAVFSFVERRDVRFEQNGRLLSPADGLELRRIDEERVRIIGYGQERAPYALVFRKGTGNRYHLMSIERTSAARLDFVYDAAGRVTSMIQCREQRELLLQYDAWGHVVRADLRFPDRSTRFAAGYVYDRAGRLVEVHDFDGPVASYEYDEQGRIVRETKRGGSIYTVRYRRDGRCYYVSGTDRYQERTLQFDLARRATAVYDSHGARTIYEWNQSGQVLQETSPLGNCKRFEYDDFGRPIAETSASGIMIRTEYDEIGRVAACRFPGGRSETYAYDAEHRLVSIVDSSGLRVSLSYDNEHNLTEVLTGSSKPWRYAYNEYAELTQVEDGLGIRETIGYDIYGNITFATTGAGAVWQYQYNALGQIIATTNPLGGTTTTEYDVSGRPIRNIGFDGRVWESYFNPHENTVRKVRPDGSVTMFQLNSCGQITDVQLPDGRHLQVFWGREPGELVALRNSRGDDYTVRYDMDGRLVERCTFDGRRILIEWKAELMKAFTDAKGQRFEFEHDAAGRVVKRTCPDGETEYVYTARGELAEINGPDGVVKLGYDERGLCVTEDQDGIGLVREFDDLGRLLKLEAAGDETRYEWSSNNDLMTLSRGALQVTFQRDAMGNELSRTLPGAGVFAQTYDRVGRLLSQTFTPSQRSSQAGVFSRSYSYEARGKIAGIDDSLRGQTAFLYDPNGSLLAALRQNGISDFYEVDGEGNRYNQAHGSRGDEVLAALRTGARLPQAAAHGGATLATTTYDQNGRLVCVEAIGHKLEYEYDANGCVISKTETDANGVRTLRLAWNARGQLVEATPPDGRTWRYRYDGCGRRIEKRTPEGRVWRYVWNCSQVVQVLCDDEVVERCAYDPSGGPAIVRDDGEVHYLLPDQICGTSEMVNAKGELEWAASKGTWGEGFRSGPGGTPFFGQVLDEETGLHYNVFRYYDPDIGRYISPDPADIAGGWNVYAAIRSPIDEYDELGLAPRQPSGRYSGPYYQNKRGSRHYEPDDPSKSDLNATRSRSGKGYTFRTDQQIENNERGLYASTTAEGGVTATRVTGFNDEKREMAFFNGDWREGGSRHDPDKFGQIGNDHWSHSEMWAFTHLIDHADPNKGNRSKPIRITICRPPCGKNVRGCSTVVAGLAQELADKAKRTVILVHPPGRKRTAYPPCAGES